MRRDWLAISVLLSASVGAMGQMMGLASLPYSATRKTTTVQKLMDGTTITRTTIVKEARDSQGRTYRQNQVESMGGPARTKVFMFNVMDPVARVTLMWSSQGGAVAGVGGSVGSLIGGTVVAPPPQSILRTLPDTRNLPKTQRERLDGKTIAGVYAEGVRITTTYPIDYFGNDRPIVQVRETWTSPELRLVVLSTDDDPRTGLRTVELTDLSRSEPDPALFQVPEGYAVKEQNPGGN